MKLTYHRNGDYLLPDLCLIEAEQRPLGKYGRMRLRYLEEHRPGLYTRLGLSVVTITGGIDAHPFIDLAVYSRIGSHRCNLLLACVSGCLLHVPIRPIRLCSPSTRRKQGTTW